MNTFQHQKGLATLLMSILIMTLSLVILVSSNKIIFIEQKVANNYYHSSKSLSAADAGIESIFAQLQADKDAMRTVGATTRLICFTALGHIRFLSASQTTGKNCPTTGAAATTSRSVDISLANNQVATVTLNVGATESSLITVSSNGCSDTSATTCNSTNNSLAVINTFFAWGSGLGNNGAALTTKNAYHQNGAIHIVNAHPGPDYPDPSYSVLAGDTYAMGGSSGVGTVCQRPIAPTIAPATPSQCETDSTGINAMDDLAYFKTMLFGKGFAETKAKSKVYKSNAPNMATSTLPAFPIAGLDSATIAALNTPIIWVDGDLTLPGNKDYGSLTNPIILIVNGNLILNGDQNKVFGKLYVIGAVGNQYQDRCFFATDTDFLTAYWNLDPRPPQPAGCIPGGGLIVQGALAIEGSILSPPSGANLAPWKPWRDGDASTNPNTYDNVNPNVTKYRFSYQNFGTTTVYYDKKLLDQIEIDPNLIRQTGKWRDF